MSWGGRRTKGAGGAHRPAAAGEAFEYELACAAIVHLDPWARSRAVGRAHRGQRVWGRERRGGWVALAHAFGGFLDAREARATGRRRPLDEARREGERGAEAHGPPSSTELDCRLGELWRAVFPGTLPIRAAPTRAAPPVGGVAQGAFLRIARDSEEEEVRAATPAGEAWVKVLGPYAGWALTHDKELGKLLTPDDPCSERALELAVPRPREPNEFRAQVPGEGWRSASTDAGWSAAEASSAAGGALSRASTTRDAVLCWVSCTTHTTARELSALVSRELPVPPAAVIVEAEVVRNRFRDAPPSATCHELGLESGGALCWRLEDAARDDLLDDDDDARFGEDPIARAFARKFDVQPKHPIGTGALGPRLRVRGDDSVGAVIGKLCAANPGLRADCVVPVRYDADRAARQQRRLDEEKEAAKAAGADDGWGAWHYDAATGKRRRKKKRKKTRDLAEREAFARLGTTGETAYARADVVEDDASAWSAGLRPGGVLAFAYVGDVQHDLGVDVEDDLDAALEALLRAEAKQDEEADAAADAWAHEAGLDAKAEEDLARAAAAEAWADARRAAEAASAADALLAERAAQSALRALAKDNAARRKAEGEHKLAQEERKKAKGEEDVEAVDEFQKFWDLNKQGGDAGTAGESDQDWAARAAARGDIVAVDVVSARGPTLDPAAARKADTSAATYCEDFMAWWRSNRSDDTGKRGSTSAAQRSKMELKERQSASEALKERGDAAYREGDFEACIIEYTRCMAMCSRPDGHFALKVRNNRAAAYRGRADARLGRASTGSARSWTRRRRPASPRRASRKHDVSHLGATSGRYKQLGNHAAVAEDCTVVLRRWPENVKALLRRAEALEACEDYEGALEDVDGVLKIRATTRGQSEVGDKNAARCVQDRSRLRRAVREMEADATGEGKRRLLARRRRAEAARLGASRVETEAQAAIRQQAEQDAAAFAVDFEDTRCVIRGCGAPKNEKFGASRRLLWSDPYHDRPFDHKATLIWLAGPDMELDELREHADILEGKTRREFPQLKIVVAAPPPGRRLCPRPFRWFDLERGEWGSRYLQANGHHNAPGRQAEAPGRRAAAPIAASTGLASRAHESRKDLLLRAQLDEACAWVSRLVDRELRLVKGGYLALGGYDEGAVVAQHVALCRRFEGGPLGALIPLNGPTPCLYHLVGEMDARAAAETSMWTVTGSHADAFPKDAYAAHDRCLRAHLKHFSAQTVPWGGDEAGDANMGYAVTILQMTVGNFKHKDLLQSDELEKLAKRAKQADSDYESEPEPDAMKELRKNGNIQAGSYGGTGGGGRARAEAAGERFDKDGKVRKHSRKCTCAKCMAKKEEAEKWEAKQKRREQREARAAKNAQIRAKNQLVVMVRAAVQTCKAAKAAAAEAVARAEQAALEARGAASVM